MSRLTLLWIVVVAGCESKAPPPPVFTVTGRITFTGGQPFPGGILTLTSVADPTITLDGEIANNGEFTLSTFHQGQRLAGGFEGQYSVMASSKFNAQAGGVAVYAPAQRVTIEPRDNRLAIEIHPQNDLK